MTDDIAVSEAIDSLNLGKHTATIEDSLIRLDIKRCEISSQLKETTSSTTAHVLKMSIINLKNGKSFKMRTVRLSTYQ